MQRWKLLKMIKKVSLQKLDSPQNNKKVRGLVALANWTKLEWASRPSREEQVSEKKVNSACLVRRCHHIVNERKRPAIWVYSKKISDNWTRKLQSLTCSIRGLKQQVHCRHPTCSKTSSATLWRRVDLSINEMPYLISWKQWRSRRLRWHSGRTTRMIAWWRTWSWRQTLLIRYQKGRKEHH